MKKRFVYELFVGIVLLLAVLLFGAVGMASFVLFAFHPYIGKRKGDEREFQLFYKIGNATAGVVLLSCIAIYLMSDLIINGYQVGEHWLMFALAAFLISHGSIGLVVLKSN